MAVRLITEMDPESEALHGAIAWLEGEAGRDPQLAIDIAFEVLSATALATSRASPAMRELQRRLVAELLERQGLDGGWDDDPIIRMGVYRAEVQRGTASRQPADHGTRGLTTCVALLALLADQAMARRG
jgi:hypothetical protein